MSQHEDWKLKIVEVDDHYEAIFNERNVANPWQKRWPGGYLINADIKSVLADNSWETIQAVSKNCTSKEDLPSSWKIGDTKTFTYDGKTYSARLVDKNGKYKRVADGSTAWLKFEVTELVGSAVQFNSSVSNYTANSTLLTSLNSGTIYGKIDEELTSVVELVKVKVSRGGGSSTQATLIDYEAKFFLQRAGDMYTNSSWSVPEENAAIELDEYYASHSTYQDKIKKFEDTAAAYWLMSPDKNGANGACNVNTGGYSVSTRVTDVYRIAFVFAL